jgi:hypothetical protein
MQPECSFPLSQTPTTCPYPEPEQTPGGISGQNIRFFLTLFKKRTFAVLPSQEGSQMSSLLLYSDA